MHVEWQLSRGFAADTVRSERLRRFILFFLSFLQFMGELTGGRARGEGLCMLAQERGVRPLLSVCMVEIHCKKSTYVEGIDLMRMGEWEWLLLKVLSLSKKEGGPGGRRAVPHTEEALLDTWRYLLSQKEKLTTNTQHAAKKETGSDMINTWPYTSSNWSS